MNTSGIYIKTICKHFRLSLKSKEFQILSAKHCQNIKKDNDKLKHLLQKCFHVSLSSSQAMFLVVYKGIGE